MQIKVGIIGLGYWGPNYVRNFIKHEETTVIWVCDISEQTLNPIKKIYPHLQFTTNYQDLLNDESLNIIAIATPPTTHFTIAKDALNAKKHVVIAKPLSLSSKMANHLLELAKKNNRVLHTDLTYLYTDAVRAVKELISKGSIGKPLYYDSMRTNLGLIQQDINVIWDLAIHDLSIIDYWFNLKPKKVFAIGSKHHKNSKTEEMAHITITYQNNFIAHIHVSWLSPVKIRTILVGGTDKMIYFDDLQPDEKVKIYDKKIELPADSITPFKPAYRSGDIMIPKLKQDEALFIEVSDIIEQIRKRPDYSNAELNIKILKLLETCDQSMKSGFSISL